MIFGLGTDIVQTSRILASINSSERFAPRILTPLELDEYKQSNKPAAFLAKRFAAKEALVKAMGTGIGRGVSWQMAQINHHDSGQPFIAVSGGIAQFFNEQNIIACHLSLSDEEEYACASVVLETTNPLIKAQYGKVF